MMIRGPLTLIAATLVLAAGSSSASAQEAQKSGQAKPAESSQKPPKTPPNIESASKLTEDEGKSDSWTYSNPKANFAKYKRFLVENTVVYSGTGTSWGDTKPETRTRFAQYLTDALKAEMKKHYALATAPGPDVAVLRLTLLGIQRTKGGLATASRIMPIGLAMNSVKSIAGKRGSFTGSVQLALEMLDAQTKELEFAAVRRRSPNALDIGAATSTENTVKAVAEDIAEAIRKGIDRANGRAKS